MEQNEPMTLEEVRQSLGMATRQKDEELREDQVMDTKFTSQQRGRLAPDTEELNFSPEVLMAMLDGYYALALIKLTNNKHHVRVDELSINQLFELGFTFVMKGMNAMSSGENCEERETTLYIDPATGEASAYFSNSIMKHPDRNIYCYLRGGNDLRYGKHESSEYLKSATPLYDVYFAYSTEEEEEYIMDLVENTLVRKCIKPQADRGYLNLVISTPSGLALKQYPMNKIDIDFDKHYNEDFKPVHDNIVEALGVHNSKGIVLLHGIKGSGKTSYIKYLTTLKDQINKKFIFLPADLTSRIATPGFIELLMSNPDSILIIEDGENVLKKRTGGDNGAVSTILNLGDGLLSDCLSIQFLITFNTNLKDIDDALTRKGRLIAEYKFEELSTDRAKSLVVEAFQDEITSPMTLADALNYKSKYGSRSEAEGAAIGFGK
jgi:hypothetical protein